MPFETECDHCNRSYKLKDELLGKKFKCSDCGSVIVAEAILPAISVEPEPQPEPEVEKPQPSRPRRSSALGERQAARKPASRRSSSASSSERPARRSAKPAATKKRRKPKSQDDDLFGGGGGAYDQYDDYTNDFGDIDEANPYADSYGSNSAPRRSSKKNGRGKSGSKRKQQGGFNVGFNVNRMNLAMAGIALAIGFYAISESRLAAKSEAEPSKISMSELIANGQPDNIYVTVTGVSADVGEYVYEYRGKDESKYTKVYIPCRARGEGNRKVGMVLLSTSLNSDMEVSPLGFKQEFTGMIVNDIRSLQTSEKGYLDSIPGVNSGSVLIFELDRKPSSAAGLFAMFGASGAMLLGAFGWMFLTGSPEAVAVPSRSSGSAGRSKKGSLTSQRSRGRTAAPLTLSEKLFSFEGRANRGQYFMTNLITGVVVFIVLIVALSILPEKAFFAVYLFALLPVTYSSLAMSAKRAHDLGHSGWMNVLLVIPLANLIWGILLTFSAGNDGSNEYGHPPA